MAHLRKCCPRETFVLAETIRERLGLMAENQEALAEARESLLLDRSAFCSRGKRVQSERIRIGNAEVIFMNAAREFHNKHGSALFPALTAAYDRLQEERDNLGFIETDLFQAEETLGSKEWEFMEQENDFYQYDLQELLPDELFEDTSHEQVLSPEPTVSPSVVQYQAMTSQHTHLMKQFDSLRSVQAGVLDRKGALDHEPPNADCVDILKFIDKYGGLLMRMMECKVAIQQQRQRLMNEAIPAAAILFPNTTDVHLETKLPPGLQIERQSLFDGTLPDPLHGLPIRHRLQEWLLGYLEVNTVQRIHFLNTLRVKLEELDIFDFEYDSWEDSATKSWLHDGTVEFSEYDDDAVQSTTEQSSDYEEAEIHPNMSGFFQSGHAIGPIPTSFQPLAVDDTLNRGSDRSEDEAQALYLKETFRELTVQVETVQDEYRTDGARLAELPSFLNENTRAAPTRSKSLPVILVQDYRCPSARQYPTSEPGPDLQRHCATVQTPKTSPQATFPRRSTQLVWALGSANTNPSTGNLEVPVPSRYDSCQESDVETTQRHVPSGAEAGEVNQRCEAEMRGSECQFKLESMATSSATISQLDDTQKYLNTSSLRTPGCALGVEESGLASTPTIRDHFSKQPPAPAIFPSLLTQIDAEHYAKTSIEYELYARDYNDKMPDLLRTRSPSRSRPISENLGRTRPYHTKQSQLQIPKHHKRCRSDGALYLNKSLLMKRQSV